MKEALANLREALELHFEDETDPEARGARHRRTLYVRLVGRHHPLGIRR